MKLAAVLVGIGILLSISGCGTDMKADLIAENNTFNKDTFRAYAGYEVTITFENKDNVTHNFSVYTSKDASQLIFKGEAVDGPGTVTYTFTAPEEPGDYYFQCDYHPATMNGTFVVAGTLS